MSVSTFSARTVRLWGLALLLAGCTDPFAPDVVKTPPSFLVVDGFINAQGITTIKLSRTLAVAAKTAVPVEAKASVYVEEENGPRYQLREAPLGTYTSAALALNPTKRYRLHLNTVGGQEYASDYVPAKITPPVDNVSWRLEGEGLSVLVNSHDATNNTQYYRWETDEVWEIRPPYAPSVEYNTPARKVQDIVVPYPTVCYGNAHSTTVLVDKTTALTQDVVSDFRVKFLLPTSERLFTRYSILVQQHALTKQEYAYWELLKKNTESIGTLFDPQPAQLTGNVHCLSNPNELALGFVGAHSLTEKRLFIARAELPRSWFVPSGYEACIPPDTVFFVPKDVFLPPSPEQVLFNAFASQSYLPIGPIYIKGFLGGYTARSRDCVDCRTRGTAVKPSYW